MPKHNKIAQNVESPDSTGGGGTACVTPTVTGHADTQSNAGDVLKSCRWYNFPVPSGNIKSLTLKADWNEDASLDISNFFEMDYTLNGGSIWNLIFIHNNVSAPGSGSVSQSIPATSAPGNVGIRSVFSADSGGADTINVSVSNVKLEVDLYDGAPIIVV